MLLKSNSCCREKAQEAQKPAFACFARFRGDDLASMNDRSPRFSTRKKSTA